MKISTMELETVGYGLQQETNLAVAIQTAMRCDMEEGSIPDYTGALAILVDVLHQLASKAQKEEVSTHA